MTNLLQQIKKTFESNQKKCPNCSTKISKTARICPECGHNFLFKEEPRSFTRIRISQDSCCNTFLILLILIALLLIAFPIFKTILLVIGAVALIIILAVLLIFFRKFYQIRKIFGF